MDLWDAMTVQMRVIEVIDIDAFDVELTPVRDGVVKVEVFAGDDFVCSVSDYRIAGMNATLDHVRRASEAWPKRP